MCGRVFVKSSVDELVANFAFAARLQDEAPDGVRPRYNGSPGQEYPIIVREPDYPGGMFVWARWGLIPRWIKDANPKIRPINARAEEITAKPMFRAAYRSRRALMPIDGFFEWQAAKGAAAKIPHAIAMKDGEPFCLAAIWETWRHPETGVDYKTFAVVTCAANELVGLIHDRMPVIVAPEDYQRWIGENAEVNDLLKPFPASQMTMWPISTRVNSPRNDDPSILDSA
jgi:putative SOS response-associated peptidase YedK